MSGIRVLSKKGTRGSMEGNSEYVIGVDLGGTNVRAHLYEVIKGDKGRIGLKEKFVKKRKIQVEKGKEYSLCVFRKTIEDVVNYAKDNFNVSRINAGVAPPGPMNIEEGWTNSVNLGWGRYYIVNDMKGIIANTLGISKNSILCKMENDVNTQTAWFANLQEYRKINRIFLGNPGTGYGGGTTIRRNLNEIVFAQEAIEVGWLNDFGLKYGFNKKRDITSDLSDAVESIDDRLIFEEIREKRGFTHSIEEAAVSGRALNRVLFDVLGGPKDGMVRGAIKRARDDKKSKLISTYAHKGDKDCIRALQIMGYHFGNSLYAADSMQALDKIIWYGNTAEFDSPIMRKAVIEGYAANFTCEKDGRKVIRTKLDIITAAKIKKNRKYEDAGAKGAALMVTLAALESERRNTDYKARHNVSKGQIYFDVGRGEAAFVIRQGKDGVRALGSNICSLGYTGCNNAEWGIAEILKLKTYYDFTNASSGELRINAIGNALADLMAWYYPDEPRKVVITGISKDEWNKTKDKVWAACCQNHKFAEEGMQFNKITLVYEPGNLEKFYTKKEERIYLR